MVLHYVIVGFVSCFFTYVKNAIIFKSYWEFIKNDRLVPSMLNYNWLHRNNVSIINLQYSKIQYLYSWHRPELKQDLFNFDSKYFKFFFDKIYFRIFKWSWHLISLNTDSWLQEICCSHSKIQQNLHKALFSIGLRHLLCYLM